MHICLSPGGPSLFRTDAPADTVMVGTTDGLTVLSRQGRDGDWQVSRRALEGRHVDALLSEPTSGTIIFAGTYGDSIYASTDDGRTWQRRARASRSRTSTR